MGKLEETLAGLQEQVDGLKRRMSEVDGVGLPLDRMSDPLHALPPGRLAFMVRIAGNDRCENRLMIGGLRERIGRVEARVVDLEKFNSGPGVPGAKTATEVHQEWVRIEEAGRRDRVLQRLLATAEELDNKGCPGSAVFPILKVLRELFPKHETIDQPEPEKPKTATEVCAMTPLEFDRWLEILLRHGYAKQRARVLSGEGAPTVPWKREFRQIPENPIDQEVLEQIFCEASDRVESVAESKHDPLRKRRDRAMPWDAESVCRIVGELLNRRAADDAR